MHNSIDASQDAPRLTLGAGVRPLATDSAEGFARLWQVFMTARVALSVALLGISGVVVGTGLASRLNWMALICGAYALLATYSRWLAPPVRHRIELEQRWPQSIGVDMVVFGLVHAAQFGNLNYAPLFAVPVLTAAILGSGMLATATAAAGTLMLLGEAWWFAGPFSDLTPRVLQAGVFGMGLFALAWLAHALAVRLAREEATARASASLARMQAQVNQLVIDTLPDGVMMVDDNGVVRAVNPAAQRMLGGGRSARAAPFVLAGEGAWHALLELVQRSFAAGDQSGTVELKPHDAPARRVLVKTRRASPEEASGQALCVVFLEDLRELEARVRTEKLAAMGRMSAAVAHEIRNPLSAITQANALLAEGLQQNADQRLSQIVHDNAKRLGRIVDDVLNATRVSASAASPLAPELAFNACVHAACADWAGQQSCGDRLLVQLASEQWVHFDAEHLRQVLLNLLDNAARYASERPGAIRVECSIAPSQLTLLVWSDGAPLDPGVEAHLFEPFFSSESRSSGLGLFLCRELCERNAGSIGYSRAQRGGRTGNEFAVRIALANPSAGGASVSDVAATASNFGWAQSDP